jgi:hypothetical protein
MAEQSTIDKGRMFLASVRITVYPMAKSQLRLCSARRPSALLSLAYPLFTCPARRKTLLQTLLRSAAQPKPGRQPTLIRCVGNHVDQSPFQEPKCGPNAGRPSEASPELDPRLAQLLAFDYIEAGGSSMGPWLPSRSSQQGDTRQLTCTPVHGQANGRANEALTPAIAIEATSTLPLVGRTRKLGGPMNRCQGLRQPASQALLVSCQSNLGCVFPRHTHPPPRPKCRV